MMASKAAKKKQNLEMYDALESTINRVTDQAQRFRRKMDELVSCCQYGKYLFSSLKTRISYI